MKAVPEAPSIPDRLDWLLTGPVLGTLAGARSRVQCLGVGDLMILTSYFDCSVGHLPRLLWQTRRLAQELKRALEDGRERISL